MVFYAIAQPGFPLYKLWIRSLAVEIEVEKEGDNKGDQGHKEREVADKSLFFFRDKNKENCSQEWEESHKAQYWKIHFKKTNILKRE